jgi:hypothetical protein
MLKEVKILEALTKNKVREMLREAGYKGSDLDGLYKSNESTNINRTENPCSLSFKYGKTATDSVKIYYEDLDDLVAKLKAYGEKKQEIKDSLVLISQIVD